MLVVVSALLEIARIMLSVKTEYTIQFVFFEVKNKDYEIETLRKKNERR